MAVGVVFRQGLDSHRNNVQLGRFGRNRTTVWEYPGINTLSKLGEEGNLLALHPTVQLVQLVATPSWTAPRADKIVLDPLLGSESTLSFAGISPYLYRY